MENNENISKETPEIVENSAKSNKNIAVIGFCAVLVIMLVSAVYFKMSKTKTDVAPVAQKSEVGTKITKTNLEFSQEEKKPFNELIIEKPKKDLTISDDPFSLQQAPVFEAKVFKSGGLAIVANTGNSENSSDNSARKKPIDFTDSSQYSFDENGNMVAKNQGGADNVEGYDAGVFVAKSAKLMNFDPNLLLPKGTFIGCSLDTRLVSSIKGGISCTISENVYSANGVTLLIEKGSKMTGFFNSGGMKDGLNRIFVVWNEIRTANNITIPISSGATDNLGGSGIEGWVDNHWFERFGSAILLSVIDDAFNFLANGATRNKDGYDYTEQARENTRDIADTALKKFIDIEPTLYKNQGDLVAVYVNRDIDFSKVYRLKKVR